MDSKKKTSKNSLTFISVLAVVSIMGFLSIISESWFEFKLVPYVESLVLLAMGIGFILESEPKFLLRNRNGINRRNFGRITTFVIGALAMLAGVLSFPYINIQHFVFLSIKGLISFIAIIFILIETWFIKNK